MLYKMKEEVAKELQSGEVVIYSACTSALEQPLARGSASSYTKTARTKHLWVADKLKIIVFDTCKSWIFEQYISPCE